MARFFQQDRLVKQAALGDPAAVGELYNLYGTVIFRIAKRMMTSEQDAEDLVQDVFIGLPKALSTFDNRGSLEGWLKKVTLRTALMRLREQRSQGKAFRRYRALFSPPSTPSIEERLSFEQALAVLHEPLRVVMVLRLEGYTHQEIGQLLEIGLSASKMRYQRACRRMRRFFDGQ